MKNKKSEISDYKIGQIIEYRRKIGKFIGKNNGEFIVFFSRPHSNINKETV